MNSTARYYGKKIANQAVTLDNSTVAELIADAAEDANADLDWSEQGDIHEMIEMGIEDAARRIASDELETALEQESER